MAKGKGRSWLRRLGKQSTGYKSILRGKQLSTTNMTEGFFPSLMSRGTAMLVLPKCVHNIFWLLFHPSMEADHQAQHSVGMHFPDSFCRLSQVMMLLQSLE